MIQRKFTFISGICCSLFGHMLLSKQPWTLSPVLVSSPSCNQICSQGTTYAMLLNPME